MLRKEPRNTEAPHINIQSPKMTSQHIKFSHKKKYCGIKDIRVLFYSSIFQMIIVFPFIVLKYILFCCHSSHLFLFCNSLTYSYFVLIVKSDSKLKQNYFCQFSQFFQFYLSSFLIHSLFFLFLYHLTFTLYCFSFSLCHPFLLFCLYVILSFVSFFSCHSVSFHLFVALLLSCFSLIFRLIFYPFICLSFDIST